MNPLRSFRIYWCDHRADVAFRRDCRASAAYLRGLAAEGGKGAERYLKWARICDDAANNVQHP